MFHKKSEKVKEKKQWKSNLSNNSSISSKILTTKTYNFKKLSNRIWFNLKKVFMDIIRFYQSRKRST